MGIQLTMRINSVSLKDSKETHAMYPKSPNTEIMMGSKTGDIIELRKSLLQNYKKNLKEPMRGREIVRDSID